MENYKKFKETVDLFKKDMAKIPKAESTTELNEIETKCVHELQLIIVEAEMCGRDLRAAVLAKDLELRNGKAV